MELNQVQRAELKLVLTQQMRQSLQMLQMTLPELREYVQEEALSNPLLELEYSEYVPLPTAAELTGERANAPSDDSNIWSDPGVRVRNRGESEANLIDWRGAGGEEVHFDRIAVTEETFTSVLLEQLYQSRQIDPALLPICDYLIHCLNSSGYLTFDIGEIAADLDVPVFQMEQALYVIQSLHPTGVGARTLEECLILQLTESRDFNAHTIRLVKDGLPLLAKQDYAGIAKLLGCSQEQARAAAQVIVELNPIPSRGYASDENVLYRIPEATLRIEDNEIIVETNRSFAPQVRISEETSSLLKQSGAPDDLSYLKSQETRAKQLMQCIHNRQSTIERLLVKIAEHQKDFFLNGGELRPVTMGQLAEELGVNISTISRALKDKCIVFYNQTIPLKDLFTSAIATAGGGEVSNSSVKNQIRRFISAEDPKKPLSDEELRVALQAVNLPVSRRTVAKYRESMQIPSSSKRRKR